DEIGTLPRRLDIGSHVPERCRIGPLEGGGGGDRPLAGGPYIYICAAGMVFASPGGFRADTVVAQERDRPRAGAEVRGPTRLGEVRARPGMRNSQRIQRLDRLRD